MKIFERIVISITLAIMLVGCAGERFHREGENKWSEGNYEESLNKLEQAVKEDPSNVSFRVALIQRRAEYVNTQLISADSERAEGMLEDAQRTYLQVLKIEPENNRARSGLEEIARSRRHIPIIDEAGELLKKKEFERAETILKLVLQENPSHETALSLMEEIKGKKVREQVTEPTLQSNQNAPISMEFRDANVKIVLEALARSTGVNFIIDNGVPQDTRVTVFLKQAQLEDALNLVLQTSRLQKKVLNHNTVLIYPNTVEKQKEYQELIVKGFYLSNASAKQTEALIKGMLKTKDMFVDEKLNLLIIRDTPDAIKLAEKLIIMHDLQEPEVMLEVEVLEVKRSRLLELGINFPNQLTLTPLNASGGTSTTLRDLGQLSTRRIGAAMPSATVNLKREVGDVNILANPRIRAKNREKAKIMIGEKVPVSTSTATSTGFVSESVQYLDVGIKLEVEPNIYLRDEIAIKIGLEVSSITSEVRTPSGSLAYQIGSRSASTVLQLKNGETQVLAGLINDEDRSNANRIPGLGDVPILGRLFGSQKDEKQKTEIVLSITPHLIRNINRPDVTNSEFWSGTESGLRTKPLILSSGNQSVQNQGTKNPGVPNSTDGISHSANVGDMNPPKKVELIWAGPKEIKEGDEFKLALRMKADGGVQSLPIQLGFDQTALQVIDVSEGGFFKQNGATTDMSKIIDATKGKVFVSVVRSGMGGAKGEDDVLVLTLKALSGKSTSFSVLSSAPIAVGNKTITPVLPAPFSVNIVK